MCSPMPRLPVGLDPKTFAIVLHKQLEFGIRHVQTQANDAGTAVFDGVINRLLGDAIQVGRRRYIAQQSPGSNFAFAFAG